MIRLFIGTLLIHLAGGIMGTIGYMVVNVPPGFVVLWHNAAAVWAVGMLMNVVGYNLIRGAKS